MTANEATSAQQCYLLAATLVSEWMAEYQRYLVDGDPNTIHPKARAALTLRIADIIENKVALAKIAAPKKNKDANDKTAKVPPADVDSKH